MLISPYYTDGGQNFILYKGSNNDVLANINKQFDMIFADPPYFLSNGQTLIQEGRQKVCDKGEWDRVRPTEEKNAFNREWLAACREHLKDRGTIWVSGTYHNIFSVATCLEELGFQILNIITWHKSDPHSTEYGGRFNFASEYIIWAQKYERASHCFNYSILKTMNGGRHMPDVWKMPSAGMWEKHCGKHPTQKPLRLLYRIILSCTRDGDVILDPFAGSCTTGIAANLLGRKFVGIDMSEEYLQLGIRRKEEISDSKIAEKYLCKMRENPEEVTVLVNHARKETRELMINNGLCYMRAGESDGSLQIKSGFERMRYVLLHTNGEDMQLFHIKKGKEGSFSIWTKETLEKHGFHPEHAAYYIVIPFDNTPIEFKKQPNLKQQLNTYIAKIRPLSDFIGIK